MFLPAAFLGGSSAISLAWYFTRGEGQKMLDERYNCDLRAEDQEVTDSVYMDIQIGNEAEPERIVIGLFGSIVPRTVQNFKEICSGEHGPMCYRGSTFHRIIPGFMAQGGDYEFNNGSGGSSIFGGPFADENFRVQHSCVGVISMANAGPDTNRSQFFICSQPQHYLDKTHVVFGRVIRGMDVLKKIDACGTASGQPRALVRIVDCGALN